MYFTNVNSTVNTLTHTSSVCYVDKLENSLIILLEQQQLQLLLLLLLLTMMMTTTITTKMTMTMRYNLLGSTKNGVNHHK